jgi:hypothetical protein
MVLINQSAPLGPIARPNISAMNPPGNLPVGVVNVKDYFLSPTGGLGFFACAPDSSTAYTATVSIWASPDGENWLATPVATIALTNVAPVAGVIVASCPWKIFGASLVVNTGSMTTVANTNGQILTDIGVEG